MSEHEHQWELIAAACGICGKTRYQLDNEALIALARVALRDAWYEDHAESGDVWCKGCGVQLYASADGVAHEHREDCPVVKARALLA